MRNPLPTRITPELLKLPKGNVSTDEKAYGEAALLGGVSSFHTSEDQAAFLRLLFFLVGAPIVSAVSALFGAAFRRC